MARFIRFPWATTGDRVAVPFPTDPSGAVSYAQGFGPDYEIAPGDPGWKPVPRDETNGLYYDLTDNIRQYQLNGVPDWYPPTENGGTPIAYPLNARVRYTDNLLYRSLVSANTAEPGSNPSQWAVDVLYGQASTVTFGVTRLATDAEARLKTATDRVLTPSNLAATQTGLLNMTVLSANGNFIVPAGVTRLYVKVIGGGGGGGTASAAFRHGGGGGGGGVAEGFITVTPGAVMAAVVGAGGAGNAAGQASSFGGLSATGGGAGSATSNGAGGVSGTGSGGQINYGLGDGNFGLGGTDVQAAGTGGGPGGSQGMQGRGPGGGGGGAYDSGGAGSVAAGPGAAGLVIIMY